MKPFKQYLTDKNYSTDTASGMVNATNRFVRWLDEQGMELEQVRPTDILAYLKHCAAHQSQATQQKTLIKLRHFFNFMIATEQITVNPTAQIQIRGVQRNKLQHILNREELDGLYQQFSQSGPAGQRNKVITGLFTCQGITTHELPINHRPLNKKHSSSCATSSTL